MAIAVASAAPGRHRVVGRLAHDPVAAAGAAFLVLVALVAVFAPVVAPHDPYAIVDRPLRPPNDASWLGTDDVGRDLLSRLIHASRVTLAVGVGAALLTASIGTLVGALAGFYGGRTDTLLSGWINVMLSIPTLPLALVLSAFVEVTLLGYGIQPPVASWGNMLQNAQRYLRTAPALAVYPGLLISLTVVSINFVGDALRDALDPARKGAPDW